MTVSDDVAVSIEVRFFASLVEPAGGSELTLQVPPSLDVEGLWQLLVERQPALGRVAFRPLVACDQVYADWDRRLEGVREVAFLPPVSGG